MTYVSTNSTSLSTILVFSLSLSLCVFRVENRLESLYIPSGCGSKMDKSKYCEKAGLKKRQWTREEDQKLLAYIEEHGHGSWRSLPAKTGNIML